MLFQLYKDRYSGYTEFETTWEMVVDAITSPRSYAEKAQAPLWTFYLTSKTPSYDDKHMPRGCADNMVSFYALQIDYDNGDITVDDFVASHEFKYYIYTSYNHRSHHHKFRVIIPLDACYGNDLMRCPENKKLLEDMFVGCDTSTINSFRRHHIPSVNPAYKDEYRYVIHDGPRLSLPWAKMVENHRAHTETLSTRPIIATNDMTEDLPDWYYNIDGLYIPRPLCVKDCVERKVIKEMDALPWGTRGTGTIHSTLCKLFGKMTTTGFTPREAEVIMLQNAPSDMHREIRGICKMR